MGIHTKSGKRWRWLAGLLLVSISLVFAFGTLEAGFRITRYLVRGSDSMPTVEHRELGWVHNVKRAEVHRTNSCGEDVFTLPAPGPYIIKYPTRTSGKRVLFLGDSTTHAHEVSTGAAYYDTVETLGKGRYRVWAAGVGGYGNLQEYLLLLKIYGEIHPEIVIWQLDSNDVSDNVFQLDRASLSSNMKPRPYLDPVSGHIAVHNPALFIFDLSHGARFLLSQIFALDIRYELGIFEAMENWLSPSEEERQVFEQQGLQVLEYVVQAARRRYPQTRFIGLALTAEDADDTAYGDIFRRHGAEYWPGFTGRVREATREPTDCLPWDRHWNHAGNRIAGSLILQSLGGTAE